MSLLICFAKCLYTDREELLENCLKSRLKSAKSPFPKVDVRRSKDSNHDGDGNRNVKTTTLRVLEHSFPNISLDHSALTTTTGDSFMRRFMEYVS